MWPEENYTFSIRLSRKLWCLDYTFSIRRYRKPQCPDHTFWIGVRRKLQCRVSSHNRINGIWMVKSPLKCGPLERLENNKHEMIEVDVSSTFQPRGNLAKKKKKNLVEWYSTHPWSHVWWLTINFPQLRITWEGYQWDSLHWVGLWAYLWGTILS